MSPLGHRPVACLPVIMPCFGLASGPCLRTRRAHPSEKTTFRVISGFPRKAIVTQIVHPPEGRAPHARNDTVGFTPACLR